MSVGGNASDRAGESAPDEAIEALYTMDVRMYAVDGVVYVCAVVLSALYIVNKSKAPREEWGIMKEKKAESGMLCFDRLCSGACRMRGAPGTSLPP